VAKRQRKSAGNGESQPSTSHEADTHAPDNQTKSHAPNIETKSHAPDNETKSHAPGNETPAYTKRLDVFIIDSGWNLAISNALMRNLDQIRDYLEGDELYILDQSQSIAMLKMNPHLIGHDPMILFLDRKRKEAGHEFYGIRLNLGLLRKPEQALARLQSALRIVAENRACPDMYHAVQKELWHAGIEGAFKVISEAALEVV
jgi:hypothetical protein